MFSIVITEKGGAQRQLDLESPEVSIGRLEDNDICLPKSNVSKHHARLVFKDDRYVLLDQKSTNGTYVNGRRISAPMVVRKGDKIYIGDFILTLAAPGGTFEGVSAREFRPRKPVSDPVPAGLTDPPKNPPTRDEMHRPSELLDRGATASLHPSALAFGDSILPGVVAPGASAPIVIAAGAPTGAIQATAAQVPATGSVATAAAAAMPVVKPESVPPEPPSSKPSPVSATPPSLPPTASARGAGMPPLPAHRPLSTAFGIRGSSVPPPLPAAATAAKATVAPPLKAVRPKNGEGSRDVASQREGMREAASTVDASQRDAAAVGDTGISEPPPFVANDVKPIVSGWTPSDQNPLTSGLTSPAVLAPSLRLQGALAMLMERLATEMNVAKAEESAFPSEYLGTIERLMDELASEGSIGPDLDRRFLREAAVAEAVGLGPLDRLLSNRSVREVVVDGPTRILADLGGGLSAVSAFFSDDSAVLVVARRLLHRAGKKFDDAAPVQEARLPSGGFLQVLLPPLSAKGPLLTVRCPPRAQSSPESLVTEGVLSTDMLFYLRTAVQQRKNILVLGAMGSGVSTLLGMLTMLAPDHERVVTIENAPSSSLLNAQTLPLSRHALPGLTLEEFLRYASRLRHDRLVIDDLSGPDALAALSAAAASPGVLIGMHAPTPQTALLQLDLFAQASVGGGRTSLAPLLASALNVLVHVATTADGMRKVHSISELRSGKERSLELSTMFRLEPKGFVKVGI